MKKSIFVFLIILAGMSQTGQAQEGFIGEIRMFAGNFAPRSWALCNGQLLPISQNQSLFSILGTTYGGDGRTTFGLPDLRGRVAMHPGNGPGLTPRRLGQRGGTETVTLTVNQMPSHSHVGQGLGVDQGSQTVGLQAGTDVYLKEASSITIGNTGGNQSVNNMPPYQSVNHIICLNGIYPSRN